jgi:8-oxo-dGTP pyrophosphatase MutT (NUDIX family)
MNDSAVLAKVQFRIVGDWLPGQVSCRCVPTSFDPPADVVELIERTWIEAQRRPGIHLFDGPMCRLESFSADTAELRLSVSKTSYKAFVGTNLHHPEVADHCGPSCLANALGISCAVVSADDYLLLGQRNKRVAYYPGRIHPFAGALEPREPMDIFDEARRELKEELGFTSLDIAEMRCLGLVEDLSLRQPELICLVCSTIRQDEIESRVDAGEHDGAFVVRLCEGDLADALKSAPLLTPVGAAAILLTGRKSFGEKWFEKILAADKNVRPT